MDHPDRQRTPPGNLQENRKEMTKTHIHHIAYTPEQNEVVLHYWGCTFNCRGCSTKKGITDWNLRENEALLQDRVPAPKFVKPPERFLEFDELMTILGGLPRITRVLHQGQEAQIDPMYPQITKAIHERFQVPNVLFTNGYRMPPLEDTDQVEIGIKAITESLHLDYTGKSNKQVMDNVRAIHAMGKKIIVESIFIPGYVDVEETEKIAEFIASVDKNIFYVILAYFTAGDNPWRRPTKAEIDAAVVAAHKHLPRVYGVYGTEPSVFHVKNVFPGNKVNKPLKETIDISTGQLAGVAV
jgi:pyruvate-formate lyase-activating enzyme